MQRLTKYGLLLAAIKKHITDEYEGEAIDEMVSVFMGSNPSYGVGTIAETMFNW